MLDLLVVLIVLAVALTAALWFGTLFLQSSIYTETSRGLFWQAPLAAIVMTAVLGLWTLINVAAATTTSAGKVEVPYGALWEFSPRVDLIAEPVPQIESKRHDGEPAIFKLNKVTSRYRKVDSEENWNVTGVEYVRFKHDDQEYHFVRDKTPRDGYVVFVDANTGLEMREFEIGRVSYYSEARVWVYFLLTAMHLVAWILCFWLILRFELGHAVGLGLVFWIVCTMSVLPGLCVRAAEAAA